MTKTSFKEATKYKNIFNNIAKWNNLTIGMVAWHLDRNWKIIPNTATFDEISDREYKPIAEFRTQEDLWQYIKINNLDN